MTNKTLGPALGRSFILLVTTAPLLTAVSALAVIANMAIETPLQLVQLIQGNLTPHTPFLLRMGEEVWQWAAFLMLCPISTAVIVEALRDCIYLDTV